MSIEQFLKAIQCLPEDKPVDDPKKWYRTQKQHWIGWLSQYHGPGAYGRKVGAERDARYAYMHIAEPKMLLWLIKAAGVSSHFVRAAKRECAESSPMDQRSASSMHQQAAAIRRLVPWEIVAEALRSKA